MRPLPVGTEGGFVVVRGPPLRNGKPVRVTRHFVAIRGCELRSLLASPNARLRALGRRIIDSVEREEARLLEKEKIQRERSDAIHRAWSEKRSRMTQAERDTEDAAAARVRRAVCAIDGGAS